MIAKKVLLIHGLAETSFRMFTLASMLKIKGFEPVSLDYPSTTTTIESLCDTYLLNAVQSIDEPFHIITHSMGGVMVRYLLQHHEIPLLQRVVMMTPGNDGSKMLTLYTSTPISGLLGPSGMQSRDDDYCFARALPEEIPVETGIIAGSVSVNPLSHLYMPWPHDGMLTVEATKLKNMKDHITLLTSHDGVMYDPIAINQAIWFLNNGQFNH